MATRKQSRAAEEMHRLVEATIIGACEAQAAEAHLIGPAFLESLARGEFQFIGYAWVATYGGRTAVTRALVALGYAKRDYGGQYIVNVGALPPDYNRIQAVLFKEAVASRVARVLTEGLGQPFYANSRLD